MRQIVFPGALRGKTAYLLDAKTAHYLIDVRRMKAGDVFEAIDEEGSRFRCTIVSRENEGAHVRLESIEPDDLAAQQDRQLQIALVQALPKGQKFDLIIRQAVELEVNLIVPVITKFCVAEEAPERAHSKLERRRRIIREALQQSGSSALTEIVPAARLSELDKVLCEHGFDRENSLHIMFHESDAANSKPLHELLAHMQNRVAICIGPEGGFSEEDYSALAEMGFMVHHAQGPIMRVETAAIFAISAVRAIALEREIWNR
jgi:16S rRNA (uracil1498-N3)-methyltransferase